MRVPFSDLTVVSYTDPASGKRGAELKLTKARQAIITLGQDPLGRIFVLQAWAARETTERYMDEIFRTTRAYRPLVFGVEANGMQVLFGETLELRAKDLGLHFPMVPVYQPTNVKKEWRIRTGLQPILAHDRLFIPTTFTELRTEVMAHPNYPTCDLVDALETACRLLPPIPTQRSNDEEANGLAEYLRNSGAPASVIEARVAEVRRLGQ